MKHKHADLLHALAEDASLQFEHFAGLDGNKKRIQLLRSSEFVSKYQVIA